MANMRRFSETEFLNISGGGGFTTSKPKARPKDLEHKEQVKFFEWAAKQKIQNLDLMHAIPNGGARHPAVAGKLKAEGVKAGVLDVQWPVARGGFVGLSIEFKAGDGNLSKEQRDRMKDLQLEGWLCVVCWEWQAAARTVYGYAGLGKIEVSGGCDD